MTHRQQQEERWCVIEGFTRYQISDTGIVLNTDTGREVKPSKTQAGQIKVALHNDEDVRQTVLVKTLVARHFVIGETEIFDTPINLDGDQTNNHYTNLAWRPRWFALQWSRQNTRITEGKKPHYALQREVMDLDTRAVYPTIIEAAQATGSAHSEIHISCMMQQVTWPDDRRYRFVLDDRLGEIGTPDEWSQVNFDYINHSWR